MSVQPDFLVVTMGTGVMRIPDYVAIGILIALAVWAAADLIPHDRFKL